MKWLNVILIGFLILFSIFLVSALESELPIPCGGDGELIIGCFGDDGLIWLSGDVPTPSGPGGGGGGTITIPEEIYQVSFDIFATHIGDYNVTDIIIVSASPIEFEEAFPDDPVQLVIGDENKLLWASDLINVEDLLVYPQPVTLWLNISGMVGVIHFSEQSWVDLIIDPFEEEEEPTPGFAISFPDISFLEDLGFTKEDIMIVRMILGVIVVFLIIFLIRRRKKKKEKEENGGMFFVAIKEIKLVDILIILGIIALILLMLFIQVKEEIISPEVVVHYYKNGVEIVRPTAEALASNTLFNLKETIIVPET